MADSRTPLVLTSDVWTIIEVDPDSDGFVEILIDQMNTNYTGTYWSTLSTTTLPTSQLPKTTAVFDYNIYVRNVNATTENPVYLSITRKNKFDSVLVANESIKTQGIGVGGVQSLIFPFGEQLTGGKNDDVVVQFQYNYLDTQFDVATSVTGAGASVGVDDSVAYAQTLTTGETARINSLDSIRYIPGHSAFAYFTMGVDTTNGGHGHGGGFTADMQNGFVVEVTSDDKLWFGFLKNGVRKGSNYANGFDEVVGHGLTLSNLNLYLVMFGYLGVANPFLFVKINGFWNLLHMVNTEGLSPLTHVSTPVFPITIMSHDGAKVMSASWNGGTIGDVASIGSRPFHFPTQILGADPLQGTATLVSTDVKTVVAFKSLTTFQSKANNVKARLTGYTFNVYAPAGNIYGEVVFQLIGVSGFTGTPTWVDVNTTSSVMQYDHVSGTGSAIVPTVGVVIAQELVSYTGSSKGASVTNIVVDAEKIGAYTYAGNTFAVIAKDRAGNGVTVNVSVQWEELF